MSASTYYTLTVSLFTIQIMFAILIDDITIIFGFFAAISESMFNFILPGLFYICSCKVSGKKPEGIWFIVSIVYVILGAIIFVVANASNIIKIVS